MKGFTIALVGIIFVVLIACSVQSISADHTEPGKGIFVNENKVDVVHLANFITSKPGLAKCFEIPERYILFVGQRYPMLGSMPNGRPCW